MNVIGLLKVINKKFRLNLNDREFLEISYDNRDKNRKSVFSIQCCSNDSVYFGFVMHDSQFDRFKKIIRAIGDEDE